MPEYNYKCEYGHDKTIECKMSEMKMSFPCDTKMDCGGTMGIVYSVDSRYKQYGISEHEKAMRRYTGKKG